MFVGAVEGGIVWLVRRHVAAVAFTGESSASCRETCTEWAECWAQWRVSLVKARRVSVAMMDEHQNATQLLTSRPRICGPEHASREGLVATALYDGGRAFFHFTVRNILDISHHFRW
jgi:hypothetical protein